jgi:hypothetical protein
MKSTRGTRKKYYNVRPLHTLLATIYTAIAVFWLGAPIICVNYEAIFQSGLLGFFIGVAFLFLTATIVGKEAIRNGTRRDFMLTYRHAISIILCASAAIFFSSFYIWNLTQALRKCDSFGSDSSGNESSVEVLVMHRVNQRLRVLSVRYERINDETTPLIRKKRSDELPWQAEKVTTITPYSQLEAEVNHLIVLNEQRYSSKKQITSTINDAIETTSRAEDVLFNELRARKICRNEQGFAISLVVLLIVMDLLNMATIGFHIWILTLG